MDDSLHLPFAGPKESIAHMTLGFMFLGMILVPSLWFPVLLWGGIAYFPMAGAAFWYAWRCRRLSHRGLILDGEGVGPAEDGVRLWTLPWSDYGGYRYSQTPPIVRITRPELGGFEILDRGGHSVLNVLLSSSSKSTMYVPRAIADELDRRVPASGFPFDPAANLNPRPGVILIGLLGGTALAGLAVWGLAHPATSKAWAWGAIATIFAPGGFLVAVFEALSLKRKAKGALPEPRPVRALPAEGPLLERHLAMRQQTPLELEEGKRYRTVEPERRRAELRSNALGIWVIPPAYLLTGVFLWLGFSDSKIWPFSALLILIFGVFTTTAIPSLFANRALLESIDDVLWVHDGLLVAVRPGKESLILPLPKKGSVRFRHGFLGATDVLRSSTGRKYYLDRTRLYEAPNIVEFEL